MLKDITGNSIKGANFKETTDLDLFDSEKGYTKLVLLYGRNGSGKSTIAREFDNCKE